MRKSLIYLMSMFMVTVVAEASGVPSAAGTQSAGVPVEVRQSFNRIEWQPQEPYDRLLLTVAGPDGAVYRQEFKAGQPPSFDIVQDGAALPDGTYTWELRLVPQLDPALRQRLEAAHRAGPATGEKAGLAVSSQAGQFVIQGGALAVEGEEARSAVAASGSTSSKMAKDQTVLDDLIVDGRLCAGFDCVTDFVFGDADVTLAELGPGIEFFDTSVSGSGFPFQNWGIFTGFEGFENFSVYNFWDITTRPFSIEGSSPTGSLWVDNAGFVGMGTTVPLWDLHITDSNTPGVLLEQDASVFAPRSWLVAGNEIEFDVTDLSAGTEPFSIAAGAPTNSLAVAANGWTGIGTATPGGQLHIFGGANNDVFAGMGPDLVNGPAFNYGYAGTSFGRGAGFFNVRPDAGATPPNPSLRFATLNITRMVIDNQGFVGIGLIDPFHPIHLASGAHVTAGGIWTNASSRDYKRDIANLTAGEALETLEGLNPVKFAYKADPAERHVGFIAEDVPDLLATADRKGLSALDVVAVLTKVVQEQQKTIEELSAKVAELAKREE